MALPLTERSMTSSVTIRFDQIHVFPGQMLQIQEFSWAEFEALLIDRGGDSPGRIRYFDGILTIMSPTPDHEFSNRTIEGLIKVVLQETATPAVLMGSTTLKGKPAGIEPDSCYYIESAEAIQAVMLSGRNRIDLTTDPPPDLVLEIDVTSLTDIQLYLPLKIPEVWIYQPAQEYLDLYWLELGEYVLKDQSHHFPMIDVKRVIPQWLSRARQEDPMAVEIAFREWVRQQLSSSKSS